MPDQCVLAPPQTGARGEKGRGFQTQCAPSGPRHIVGCVRFAGWMACRFLFGMGVISLVAGFAFLLYTTWWVIQGRPGGSAPPVDPPCGECRVFVWTVLDQCAEAPPQTRRARGGKGWGRQTHSGKLGICERFEWFRPDSTTFRFPWEMGDRGPLAGVNLQGMTTREPEVVTRWGHSASPDFPQPSVAQVQEAVAAVNKCVQQPDRQ